MGVSKTTKFINFHNNTSEIIILETWIKVSSGLSSFKSKTISPGEKLGIYSSVGEWYIYNNTYRSIGKIRSDPCASGNYSWLANDDYTCVYTKTSGNENGIIGLITLSKK
jgi:hypothetical protein